jgi:hypothetical protein
VRDAVLVLVLVLLVLVVAPARAAMPSTVTLRGDATHDNRVTGAPEPPLGVAVGGRPALRCRIR